MVCIALTQPLGQALRLLAEHERHLGRREIGVGITHLRLCREQPEIFIPIFGDVLVDVLIHRDIDQMPVVKSGALDGAVGNIKPERFDQVQPRTRAGTGTRNGAGVVRDLRLHQNDIYHNASSSLFFSNSQPIISLLLYYFTAFFAIALLNKAATGNRCISELFVKHAEDHCIMDEKTL